MNKGRGYLLFELLCAMIILSTAAVFITRAFSKQMEMTGLAFQQLSVLPFFREKIFEIEKKIKETPQNLEALKKLSGEIPETHLKWDFLLKNNEKFPSLLQGSFTVSGFKNERTFDFNIFLKAPEGVIESQDLLDPPQEDSQS